MKDVWTQLREKTKFFLNEGYRKTLTWLRELPKKALRWLRELPKKTLIWLKELPKKTLIELYSRTWILATTWTLLMIIITLLWEYNSCLRCANAIEWITDLGKIVLVVFFITFALISILTILQISTIRNNKKQNPKNPLENIAILAPLDISNPDTLSIGDKKINVLPWYMIGIYSLSKIIISICMIQRGKESVILDYDVIWIWPLFLMLSFGIWNYLKQYSRKNKTISIGYTIFVVFVTWLTLEWQTLIPYFIDISEISQCVVENYVIEHNLSADSNISKCAEKFSDKTIL